MITINTIIELFHKSELAKGFYIFSYKVLDKTLLQIKPKTFGNIKDIKTYNVETKTTHEGLSECIITKNELSINTANSYLPSYSLMQFLN